MRFALYFEDGIGGYIDRKVNERIKIILDSIEKDFEIKKSGDFINEVLDAIDGAQTREDREKILIKYFFEGGVSKSLSRWQMDKLRSFILNNLNSLSRDLILFYDKIKREFERDTIRFKDKFRSKSSGSKPEKEFSKRDRFNY